MDRRVLITGVTGFAGTYVAKEFLSAGYDVLGTSHRSSHNTIASIDRILSVDLQDLSALTAVIADYKPTHVVHLAAVSFVAHSDVSEVYQTNVVGTRNLLQCLSKLKVLPESVLLTSSANIYGNSDAGHLDELAPPCPENDYAVSKIAMEYMARQFVSHLNIIIARPFNYTGRGQNTKFLVPKIVDHFVKKKPFIELGNTDIARDFSDVRSVANCIRRLIEKPDAGGQVYNICSGSAHTLKSILESCASLTSHEIEVRVNPDFVRTNEVKSLVGNPQKVMNAIGNFQNFTLEETLTWMLGA